MLKLKLFLLLGILSLFGFIGFSNAEIINFECTRSCNPSTITVPADSCVDYQFQGDLNIEGFEDHLLGQICNEDESNCIIYGFYDGEKNIECAYDDPEGDLTLKLELSRGTYGSISFGDNSGGDNPGGDNPGGDNPGGDNPGGDNSGGDNSGGVISDGFSSFTAVIMGIKDTTFQLIPLVVYIGIGVLIVVIGFFAIRWLVNWIVGKINSNFSSKRD